MSAFQNVTPRTLRWDALAATLRLTFLPVQALVAVPSYLFLFTMALMLFRPPDYRFHSYDRFAFVLLMAVVVLRICVLRQRIHLRSPLIWPMAGLLALAFFDSISQPFNAETWSMFASKWFIPFVLFYVAGIIFKDDADRRDFETFALVALAYLSLIAIFFMVDAKQFIFPRYILDEGLGIHADRARGPFLQAVANGVALNILGLLALDSFRRRRLRGVWAAILLAALPFAILATKTRSVWLSFAASIALLVFSRNQRLRRLCVSMLLAGALGLLAICLLSDHQCSLSNRLAERSPVEFRMAMYQAGAEMFLMKPLLGWGGAAMQAELAARVSDFHQEEFYFHNTYLEIAVQYGLLGFALYLWLVVALFRVGRRRDNEPDFVCSSFADDGFRSLWPLILLVYLVNASFVVMNYQFVNGLVFSLAGILAAQNRQDGREYVRAS